MAESSPPAQGSLPRFPVIAPLGEPFPDVRHIAVLRGGGLGDVLFALPAMQSLADAYPQATITLLGTPMHRTLFEGREGPVHNVEVLPISRGIREAGNAVEDPAETERFFKRMRARGVDLAVQLHGGGRFSNPFLLRLGARHTVGTRTPDAGDLERSMPYLYYQQETMRELEVVGLAGARPVALEPMLTPTAVEREYPLRIRHEDGAGIVVIHPGATDPRRRWPASRFADVAHRLLGRGAYVLVVGDESDVKTSEGIVGIAREGLADAASRRIRSLAGKLTLSELVGLLTRTDVLLGNDSGPRHLAHALGVRTVGIFWFGNLVNAGPLGRSHHRVHISWTTRCPVCGRDATQAGWTAERCEHNVSFVDDVDADAVTQDAQDLLDDALGTRPSSAESE